MSIDAIALNAISNVPSTPPAPSPAATPALADLENRFNRLMLDAPLEATPASSASTTAVGDLIRYQDQLQHQLVRDVARFSDQAPHMDMATLTAHQVEMTFRVAQVQLQFTAATSVAQSTKSGLQTLMKNQ